MSEPLFAASRLKLERAEHFIKELGTCLETYRQSNWIRVLSIDTSESPHRVALEWSATGLMPGAIVGDAIHNLRTALDLVASELVRMGQSSDRGVYFPFGVDAAGLEDEIKKKRFYKAGSDAVDLLRKFAPYHGGNEALRAIHDLDIQDKHRALIVTGSTMNVEVAGSYNIDDPTKHDLTVVASDIHYVFPEGWPLGGRPVIETLKELVQLVHGIIEAFSRMVELRRAGPSPNP
jgi:hypothetical protein